MEDATWEMPTKYYKQFDKIIRHDLSNTRNERANVISFSADENNKQTIAKVPKHIMDLLSPQAISQLREFADIIV